MYDAEEGFYPDDDSDLTERISSHFGVCSQCGCDGYLFGTVELIIDEEGTFECTDICVDCLCDVVREFKSDDEAVEN